MDHYFDFMYMIRPYGVSQTLLAQARLMGERELLRGGDIH